MSNTTQQYAIQTKSFFFQPTNNLDKLRSFGFQFQREAGKKIGFNFPCKFWRDSPTSDIQIFSFSKHGVFLRKHLHLRCAVVTSFCMQNEKVGRGLLWEASLFNLSPFDQGNPLSLTPSSLPQ